MNKAKEYLELKGYDQTYWGKKIIAAEKRGRFTESNINHSADWVTCACGRVTADIPRDPDTHFHGYNTPLDAILRERGFDFYTAVDDNRFLKAAQTLVSIEARAIVVAKAYLQEQRA
jgi:hypothetical protein